MKNCYYVIYLDGIENAERASEYIGRRCYCALTVGGRKVGQMERVLEDLVSVSYIAQADVGPALDALRRIGFGGQIASVELETENGCFADAVPGSFFAVRV